MKTANLFTEAQRKDFRNYKVLIQQFQFFGISKHSDLLILKLSQNVVAPVSVRVVNGADISYFKRAFGHIGTMRPYQINL